jgi:hypothetical protein
MSNYYKTDINLNKARLSDLIKYVKNANYTTSFGTSSLTLNTSYTSVFSNTINEAPNPLGYKYLGTDISTFSIATWVESAGSTTFTSIPTWCTKIRAVLIGGGGGAGGSGTANIAHQTTGPHGHGPHGHGPHGHGPHGHGPNGHGPHNHNHQHTHGNDNQWAPDYNLDYNPDYNPDYTPDYNQDNVQTPQPAQYGGGGGGGGFAYLSTYDIASNKNAVTVSLGSGGGLGGTNQAGQTGGSTTLTLPNSLSVIANGGGAAQSGGQGGGTATAAGGAAGGVQAGVTATTNSGVSGVAGTTTETGTGGASGLAPYSSNSTMLTYGVGGNNAAGTGGYYRIYFLTS